MAEKHFTKARGYLVKGDEMYRKAAAEIRAGMKADPSLTQEEIGRWFGHSQSWVQRLLAWDKDYSSTNNPTPFVRPANKTANDTKAFLRDAPMEVVERVLDDLPKERKEQIAAATGDSYMQAKRDEIERRARKTDEERQADWEAAERLNEIQQNLFGQEGALSIRLDLLHAATTLSEMIEARTLTPKAARLIEIDNDEWQQKLIDAQEHITGGDE